ncbi:MAG: class I SAM-dependent methyltransferase [Candidatus Helarchaeota archaeon]
MNECWSVIVRKKEGEKIRQWLINQSLLDRSFKIRLKENWLIFPLVRELSTYEEEKLKKNFRQIRFERQLVEMKGQVKARNLYTALQEQIPESLHSYIPKSFDIIGKIIIIEIPDELTRYDKTIGETLLKIQPQIQSVFKKVQPVRGEFRLRDVEFIAGINCSETIHRENKCNFKIDVKKVYFSPRLATEHERVATLVKNGEIILDMFAGVGPFSILMAKLRKVKIWAVDINPAAIYYLRKNISMNKVEHMIKVFEGDVREIWKKNFNFKFDRIVMNLPSEAIEFLDIALELLKKNGVLHFYQFVPEKDYPNQCIENIGEMIEKSSRNLKKLLNIRKVRAYAPYIWHVGIDLLIE